MLVLLGEVGGVEEYRVCEALKSGRINKPMVAWCIGTCGDMFTTDVQVKTWIFSFLQLLFTKKVSFRLTFALDKVWKTRENWRKSDFKENTIMFKKKKNFHYSLDMPVLARPATRRRPLPRTWRWRRPEPSSQKVFRSWTKRLRLSTSCLSRPERFGQSPSRPSLRFRWILRRRRLVNSITFLEHILFLSLRFIY